MKTCNTCNITKNDDEFYYHRLKCKNCIKEYNKKYSKKYYNINKEIIKKRSSDYNKNNPKKSTKKTYECVCNSCQIKFTTEYSYKKYCSRACFYKKYKKEHVEKLRGYQKEYNKKYSKNYCDINKEKKKIYDKEYLIKNKEKIYNRYYKRYKEDNLFRLKQNIRNIFNSSLKKVGCNNRPRTIKILGCSFDEFKHYLELKFEPWMSWDNRGLYCGKPNYGWDVDHIIPLSSAKTEEDVIKLNHYTNLQPLCSYINRDVKVNKII